MVTMFDTVDAPVMPVVSDLTTPVRLAPDPLNSVATHVPVTSMPVLVVSGFLLPS